MSNAKVLVVEDEGVVAEGIGEMLKDVGYSVVGIASSGVEAVRLAARNQPDLVLMDIKLQGRMDGIEASRSIQACFDIPVVYLTAYADHETVSRARKTLSFGFISKPCLGKDLRGAIEVALARHQVTQVVEERSRWLGLLLQSMGDAVVAIDREGYVTLLNPAAESLTGWTQDEALGKRVAEIVRLIEDDTREVVMNPALHTMVTGDVVTISDGSILMVSRHEEEFIISDCATPLRDDNGQIMGAIMIFRKSDVENGL